ncbi:uncharacterized protein VTP21DRAFT_2997 [Calcarisporiella thermophila]|uniref:uncharacterized protein n=1 Tax=Calcarisporiella thermophila TaxID=911321 RepID=UPI003743B5E2
MASYQETAQLYLEALRDNLEDARWAITLLPRLSIASARTNERGNPELVFNFTVSDAESNSFGIMHGGCTATLIDICTSIAVMALEKETFRTGGVSTNLAVNYISGAHTGTALLVKCCVRRVGKSLAFLDCDVVEKESGKLIATATHTKYEAAVFSKL